ncbi:MAG TPA: beta-ketoacyl synthase N-terminal-like domain-containing protein, partial [Pirellulales bacterium]
MNSAVDIPNSHRPPREGIAVVGIGCRFPGGGRGPGGYWQMLRGGRDAVGDAPEWRGLGAGL